MLPKPVEFAKRRGGTAESPSAAKIAMAFVVPRVAAGIGFAHDGMGQVKMDNMASMARRASLQKPYNRHNTLQDRQE